MIREASLVSSIVPRLALLPRRQGPQHIAQQWNQDRCSARFSCRRPCSDIGFTYDNAQPARYRTCFPGVMLIAPN